MVDFTPPPLGRFGTRRTWWRQYEYFRWVLPWYALCLLDDWMTGTDKVLMTDSEAPGSLTCLCC
jgi:hypothetical protein